MEFQTGNQCNCLEIPFSFSMCQFCCEIQYITFEYSLEFARQMHFSTDTQTVNLGQDFFLFFILLVCFSNNGIIVSKLVGTLLQMFSLLVEEQTSSNGSYNLTGSC